VYARLTNWLSRDEARLKPVRIRMKQADLAGCGKSP
jgi:hypothetical protein